MSLQTWLLLLVLILLIAFCGISLFAFFALFSRIESINRRWADFRGFGPKRFDREREHAAPVFARMDYLISDKEERYNVQLTGGARQLLIIPVEEQIYDGRSINWGQVDESVDSIFRVLGDDTSQSSRASWGAINSIAVIKAFHKRFCNIPPFCAPTE